MSKIPYYVRYTTSTTIDSTDSMILDVEGSDVPKLINYENVVSNLSASILENQTTMQLFESIIEQNKKTIKLLKKIAEHE